jgi:AcrR family transcriptional regulator
MVTMARERPPVSSGLTRGGGGDQRQDRRTRRTRKALQNAVIELLRNESLSKITVSQIAARADVSRQAFYLHFSSKEDLLLSHLDDIFASIRAALVPSPAHPQRIGLRNLLVAAFVEWQRHAGSLQLVMRLDNRDQLMERIRLHISDVMSMFARYGREDVTTSPLLSYIIDYRSGGMFMLLKSWLNDGCRVSAEEMAGLVYEMSLAYVQRPPGVVERIR